MKSKLIIIGMILFLASCSFDKKELSGIYVSEKQKNIDTLVLHQNGTYIRKLYVKENNDLILSQKGKWDFDDHYLDIEDFLIDLDNEYPNDYEFDKVLTHCSFLPNRNRNGVIYIDYGPYMDKKFVYSKIK